MRPPSDAPSLIPSTPDLRIGPLPPGASATAEMRFLVLRGGVLKVDVVRVLDLDSAPGEGGGEGSGEVKRGGRLDDAQHVVELTGAFLPDIVAVEDGA